MRSSRHCSRAGPGGTSGRAARADGHEGLLDLVGAERVARGSRGQPAGARPAMVNSAATADGGLRLDQAALRRAALLVVAQQAPPPSVVDAQQRRAPRSPPRRRGRRRGRQRARDRPGAPTPATRISSSAVSANGWCHMRRQPGAVVVRADRQVEPLGQRDATVLEPHDHRALAGMEPQQVRHGGDERVGAAQDEVVEDGRGCRCHGGTLPEWSALPEPAHLAGGRATSARRRLWMVVSRRWTAGRRPTTRARPGAAGAGRG